MMLSAILYTYRKPTFPFSIQKVEKKMKYTTTEGSVSENVLTHPTQISPKGKEFQCEELFSGGISFLGRQDTF